MMSDFHPAWQQISIFDPQSGAIEERKLVNGNGEAEAFYRDLPTPSLIGIESCGNSQWLIDRLQQLGHEVWVGDAAQIRASYVRQQKTDRRDAAHSCCRCWISWMMSPTDPKTRNEWGASN